MGYPSLPALALSVLCSTALCASAAAQSADLDRLNALCGGQVHWRVDGTNTLTIDVFAEGERYRRDAVALRDLGPEGVGFSPAEGGFVLMGREGQRPIAQEVFKTSTVKRMGRSVVPCPLGPPQADEAVALLRRCFPGFLAPDETLGR
jgi:hypothetical protein